MAPRKQVRKTKPTLLLVGEGFCEKAFLAHLKGMYSLGHIRISICTAKGKGPDHVIKHALSCKQCDGYDRVAVLLDTDLPWPKETVKRQLRKGYFLLVLILVLKVYYWTFFNWQKKPLIMDVRTNCIHCYQDHPPIGIVMLNVSQSKF